ncbi:Uu.00g087640.m01.CDS01 [Anthostomella pinea]|uniref:Uu.00g087640.m01.CDS01 n=1 Tax=Anthostomella pinea TaxID=933095 RepID=A0AAI8YK52_9PEZI|nr:Uu.00g087640.m01.CDS01 [Anthostomella pinea]
MKFAKELEQDLVPEWRIKYLNYKAGKKYVKGVARAINRASGTPRGTGRKGDWPPRENQPHRPSPLSYRQQSATRGPSSEDSGDDDGPLRTSPAPMGRTARTGPVAMPVPTERHSLTRLPGNEGSYGSFVATPPPESHLAKHDSRTMFELPAPAIRVPSHTSEVAPNSTDMLRQSVSRSAMQRSVSMEPTVPRGLQAATLPRSSTLSQQTASPGRLRRFFSAGQQPGPAESTKFGYDLQALDTIRQREREFFDFLDSELNKVDTFYRQKEEQAGHRLTALREQLHEMRNRRTQELADMKRHKEHEVAEAHEASRKATGYDGAQNWINPIKAKIFKPGENSKAFVGMVPTPIIGGMGGDERRDYTRRPHDHSVPYKTAKRKLKLALQEFYRGLELLKSYALLNRTAFRKLNKKYDKTVNARPPYRYMNEKVGKSWFVNSDIIDGHIRAVEDLYARYFEKGNRKLAAGKLRRVNRPPSDESGIAFRNGLFIGIGAVFAVQGLVYGVQMLFDPDPVIRQRTSYLLQIYGGYFLMVFLFALFCIDCYIWRGNRVNYPFIFEFDTRHSLDWRQLASFPSLFLLLFGVFFWVNFSGVGGDELFLYYPVILVFISLIIILLPAPILYHRSRQWFAYSHYRLFFAGLYPVEFRDFFLGDIYCSLTYSTANVELFFCLYAHYWNNPPQCNSNHSRLLGFFTALPPIWRALQCLRRYYDTKNVFPHLVNCGKYGATILTAIILSLYRINGNHTNLALFVTVATINSIYTSIWDLFMDFSLLQQDSQHRFLRDILALKRRWVYYAIMIIDPILRFGWIFYAIFTYDKQHSTYVSFLVALAEAVRRGMWALLRVENEHCGNVSQYKASRDLPLPYHFEHEPLVERASSTEQEPSKRAVASGADVNPAGASVQARAQGAGTAPDEAPPRDVEGLRRRKTFQLTRAKSIRGIMADAHKQDFEKKRRPAEPTIDAEAESAEDVRSDEDEDDDDETGSMLDERMEVRRAVGLVRGLYPLEPGSSSDEEKGPCRLPDGQLVCTSRGLITCAACCTDYNLTNDDGLSNEKEGEKHGLKQKTHRKKNSSKKEAAIDAGLAVTAARNTSVQATGPPRYQHPNSLARKRAEAALALAESEPETPPQPLAWSCPEKRRGTGRVFPKLVCPFNASDTPTELFPGRATSTRTTGYIHHRDPQKFLLFTGGARAKNGRGKGWAFVHGPGLAGQPQVVSGRLEKKGPFGDDNQPNIFRAELRAVIAALRFRGWADEGFTSAVIATDSEYVYGRNTDDLKRKIWKGRKKNPLRRNKHYDYWETFLGEVERLEDEGLSVQSWLIPSGWNTVANAAAEAAAKEDEVEEWTDLEGLCI